MNLLLIIKQTYDRIMATSTIPLIHMALRPCLPTFILLTELMYEENLLKFGREEMEIGDTKLPEKNEEPLKGFRFFVDKITMLEKPRWGFWPTMARNKCNAKEVLKGTELFRSFVAEFEIRAGTICGLYYNQATIVATIVIRIS